jgi:NYN domain-containing protein
LREDAGVPEADAMRLAVLIDSDNTTASLTTELLEEIAKYGTPTIKRAYGDWTTPRLVGWKATSRGWRRGCANPG